MEEIVEIPDEVLLDIKEETEELVEYPLPEELVTANPLDIPSIDEQINQFCRLCLRERPNLIPLMSRIKDVTLPDMIRSVTGLMINLRADFPRKLCIDCVKRLDYAFNIQQDIIQSDKNLRRLAHTKHFSLLENLTNYQKGLLATTETYAEKLFREQRDAIRLKLVRQKDSGANASGEGENKGPEESVGGDLNSRADDTGGGKPMDEILQSSQCNEALESNCDAVKLSNENNEDKTRTKKRRFKKIRIFSGIEVEINEAKLDPNKCYICEHVAANSIELNIHTITHAAMIPYDCEECTNETGKPVRLTTTVSLQKHFRKHASPMKCPKCPFRTCVANRLGIHINHTHGEQAKTGYVCEICGSNLRGLVLLRQHMYAHKAMETGRYQCSICERKFATKLRLTNHEQTHTQRKRAYSCEQCGKAYTNSHQLNSHMNAHNNIRPFSCEICGASFVRIKSLQDHKLKHSDTLKFPCPYCNQRFRYNCDRYKHKKTCSAAPSTQVATVEQKEGANSNVVVETMEIVAESVVDYK